MIPLLLTIICSTSIALILKTNDVKKGQPFILLSGNYLAASLICIVFIVVSKNPEFSFETFWFGIILGLLFVIAFFIFAESVSRAGTALAVVSSRLSVLIPIILSIIIFHETPNVKQVAGFFLTIATIIFFYYSLKTSPEKKHSLTDYLYLILLLIGIGINDFGMKVFQQLKPMNEKPLFLLCIFGSAFIYSQSYVFLKKIMFKKRTFIRGLTLGIPNIFSSFFLIGALSVLPAIIVFPSINISIIVLTSISAYLIWKEKLNTCGVLSIISGSIAILLFGIS
ncbi:MAG: EamA family transporter [bacterium]